LNSGYVAAIQALQRNWIAWGATLVMGSLLPLTNWIPSPCSSVPRWCTALSGLAALSAGEAFKEMVVAIGTIQLTVVGFVCPLAASAVSRAAESSRTAKVSVRIFFQVSGIWVLIASSIGLLASTLLVLDANPLPRWAGVHLLIWAVLNLGVTTVFLALSFQFLGRDGERRLVCGYAEKAILQQSGGPLTPKDDIVLARCLPFYEESLEEAFSGEARLDVVDTITTIVSRLSQQKSVVLVRSLLRDFLTNVYEQKFGETLVANIGQADAASGSTFLMNWIAIARLVDKVWLYELDFQSSRSLELKCDRITTQAFVAAAIKNPELAVAAIPQFVPNYEGYKRAIPFVLIEVAYIFGALEKALASDEVLRKLGQADVWYIVLTRYMDACIAGPHPSTWRDLQEFLQQDPMRASYSRKYPDSLLFLAVFYGKLGYATKHQLGTSRWNTLASGALLDALVTHLKDPKFRVAFDVLYEKLWPRYWEFLEEQKMTGGMLMADGTIQPIPPTVLFAPTFAEQVADTIAFVEKEQSAKASA
jgi:hypothetical protein